MNKRIKDHNAPKRPLPAYFLYLADKRDSVSESILLANPRIGKKKLFNETVIKLAEDWKKLSNDVMKIYQQKSLELEKEYNIKKSDYDKILFETTK